MKNFLILMVMFLSMPFTASASDTTGASAIVKSGVKDYLAIQGYLPSIDSDGDITFKAEGRTYYISFLNYDEGSYVDFYYILDTADSNHANVLSAANKAQKSLKFVRIDVLNNERLTIDILLYVETANQFNKLFSDMLSILQTARSRVIDYYED